VNEKEFYEELWRQESQCGAKAARPRDWIHRMILDRISDPYANDRTDIAARMLRAGHRILDLGTWGGGFLGRADIQAKFSERHGLDLPSGSVDAAMKRGIAAKVWNLNEIPYPFDSGYFDAVTALAVLEHVFDPISGIREIARLVRPGGQAIVCLPNVASLSNRVRVLLGFLPVTSLDPGWDGGHLHYFTIAETRKLLERSGFRVTHVGISGATQKLRMRWPSLLSGEFILGADRVTP